MTEEIEAVAPSEATPEVVQPEAEQEVKTEGQVETPPASEPEEKSEAQKRRERRRAQEQRQQEEYDAAQRIAKDAEAKLARIKAAAQGVEPKEADFTDVGEYWAAKGAWNYARQAAQFQVTEVSAEAEQAKAAVEATRAAQVQARQAEFFKAEQEARQVYADYDAVTRNPALNLSNEVVAMIQDSDGDPAALAYYLCKNPELADRLSKLPPQLAARELGKIEATLTVSAPKISKAPAPINPVKPSGVASKDFSKMTVDEIRSWKQGQKK